MLSKRYPFASLIIAFGLVAPAGAQPAPLGPEIELDPVTKDHFFECPAVAGRGDGGVAVGWYRYYPPHFNGPRSEILSRAVTPGGALEPLRLLDTGEGGAMGPLLAPTANGYTALWRRSVLEPPDKYRFPHLVQELDAQGTPISAVLDLARGGTEVTPRPGGGTAVLWKQGKVLNLQLLDEDGKAVAPPVKLRVPNAVEWHAVHGPDGDLVVWWHSTAGSGRNYVDLGHHAQRIDARGRPAGKTFTLLAARRREPSRDRIWAALGADGTLAVAAAVDSVKIGLGGITLRTFDKSGKVIGDPFQVTSATHDPKVQSAPAALAVAPDGRVLLVWWVRSVPPYLPAAEARVFTREALPEGEPFALHSPGNSEAYVLCANAAWAGGSWAVAWMAMSQAALNQPTLPLESIYVRRFAGE